MFVRRLVSTLLVASLAPTAFGLGGCGQAVGDNAASKLLKTPDLPSDKEARCRVRKSQSEPLIVEWANATRGRLESMTKRSLVAIKYEGCELTQLPACTVKSTVGAYQYWPITRKQSRVTMHNADELYANMPVGAFQLEGKLETAGQLDVQMTIVGRYEAPTRTFYKSDLEGECEGATHVIAALTTGSFTFSAGSDAEVGGGVKVGPAGGGAKSTAKREMLQSDGDEAACARASANDKGPPEGCGALLQIEVATLTNGNRPAPPPPPPPIVVAPPVPVPTPPPVAEKPVPAKPVAKGPKCKKGLELVDGLCSKVAKPKIAPTKPTIASATLNCRAGQHKEGTKCVDDPPPEPAWTPPPPPPPPPLVCADGMRVDGDRCVSGEPPPPPSPIADHAAAPTVYDDPTHATEHPNPLRTGFGYTAIGASIVWAIAGYVALGDAAEATKDCGGGGSKTCKSGSADLRSTAVTAAIISDVGLGITVVSLVAFFLLPSNVKVGIAPTSHGVAGGASWMFR